MMRQRMCACIPAAGLVVLLAGTAVAEDAGGWRQTFATMPKDWEIQGKPGVDKARFEGGHADGTNRVLRMTSDKASATFKSGKLAVDLNRTPVMRWRWKAVKLPDGADGRKGERDDQAIGLYVSAGGMLSQKSVALRWETETPKDASGRAKYAGGVVSIFWKCIRNKADVSPDGWFIDEVNVADCFRTEFGEVPAKIGLGVSCNSQYTGTKAEALLDWVEFAPAAPAGAATKQAETAVKDRPAGGP